MVNRPDRPLRIAMIGQRGVPATHGGVEHHVAHLGRRLAERGHEVTVYCRTNYVPEPMPEYHGMRLSHLPTLGTKHFDAIVHSALSTLVAGVRRPDIVHYHALGPGLCAPLPRLLPGPRVVQTVHGMDNRRAKWGRVARTVLGSARRLSDLVPDGLIAVSEEIAAEYAGTRRGLSVRIPNGVDRPAPVADPGPIAARYGLRAGKYVLYVGRLVPEKAPDLLMRAFRGLDADIDLAIVGGWAYAAEYAETLEMLAAADRRIHMLGYLYGEDLAAIYAGAAAFVQPSELEGMPLTLLESAAHGSPIVASAIPPHREVLGPAGPGARFFRPGDEAGLRVELAAVLADLDRERIGAAVRRERILDRFSWEAAADATERLYYTVLGAPVQASIG